MATARDRQRNNVRMGVFVSSTIIIAVAIVIILSGVWDSFTRNTHEYTVKFPVTTGVRNLQPGADVRIGGVPMGAVERVRLVPGDPARHIEVDFELDEVVHLYTNARIVVAGSVIGSEAWLSIVDAGEPTPVDPDAEDQLARNGSPLEEVRLVQPGESIDGSVAGGLLSNLVGPENAERADQIIADVRDFAQFLADVDHEYDERIVPMLEDANLAMDDAVLLLEDARADYQIWREDVTAALDAANSAADELDALVTAANTAFADNRGQIDAIVDNADVAMADASDLVARFKEDAPAIIERVETLLDRGNEGIDAFASVGEELEVFVNSEIPGIRDTLANARLASQQLKLTTVEVRRSPWKLLYRPSADELEHEMLYEAARSFAVAASDLKAAAQSVDRIMTIRGDALGADEDSIRRLETQLLDSYQRYETAQQRLVDVLLTEE